MVGQMRQRMDDAVDPAGMISPPAAPAAGRRRRIAARRQLDFWFDAVLLVGFTLAYSYGFTGIAIHEWLGIGLGAALLLHVTLHWDWVIRTTRKLLSPRGNDKVIWLVNLALLVAMTFCVASGILISRVALPSLAIVLLAMAWNHAAGGGLASGPLHGHDLQVPAGRLAKGPHGEVVLRVRGAHGLEVINARPMDLGLLITPNA
jgi:hypothetical protein